MAYGKKWTLPFKSLNNTDCRVDIYQDGYSGDAVITLTGAPNPFSTTGQTTDDTFAPVRLQSGYIRIICADDSWRNMIPKYNRSHMVKFYYGTKLKWEGYMRAEMYEHSLYNGVDEYEFPLICPLSLLEQAYLDDEPGTINTNITTFHALLAEILGKIGFDFPVYFTKITQDDDFIKSKVNRMLYFEDNKDFHISQNKKIFKSYKSCMDILSDYCRFWGFTCELHLSEITFGAVDLIDSENVPILRYHTLDDLKNNLYHIEDGPYHRTITEPIADKSSKEKIIPPRASIIVEANCDKSDLDISVPNMEDCLRMGYQTYPLLVNSFATDTEGQFLVTVQRALYVRYTTTGVSYEQKYDYEFPKAHYTFYDYDYPES